MALSSGGGAATLRLVSLRLPCSEGKGGDGRRGAGTEWLRRWGGGGAEGCGERRAHFALL